MTIGDRIKQRRIQIGLTVDQLADKIGKNRATVYRYESNEIEKFPLDILYPLANALRTSPAYLMGWSSDPDTELSLVDRLCPSSIEASKDIVYQRIGISPDPWHYVASGRKLKLLLQELGTDVHSFCDKFEIDEYQFYHWVTNDRLPDYPTVHQTLQSLNYRYLDLLSYDEAGKYMQMEDNFKAERSQNFISIAGRDGSYERRTLTDQQLSALKAILAQMPDASDDL